MIKINETFCPANHKCPVLKVCPHGAIIQNGFSAPKIIEEKCTNCGKCIKSCPTFQFEK
jgi:dissimilatory sulfite reductase (desulfoviridin) alpha/beta subunit